MTSTQELGQPENPSGTLRALGREVRESLLLRIAVFGILLIFAGYVINYGVWAAILPTWGVAMILLGVGGYAFVWWNRR